MRLKFTKMQGVGNDFVVIDAIRQKLDLTPARVRFLADRHFGIGADQVLLVESPSNPGVDFKYRIFNCDGGEVEHCGNGARCFVKFVHDNGLTDSSSIRVQVSNGELTLKLLDDGQVEVEMGAPRFDPASVPFDASNLESREMAADRLYGVDIGDRMAWLSVLSMGNPHAVQVVDDVEQWPVLEDGPRLESHPRFPQRVNVGFMQVQDRHTIKLRVFERGAGETLACGTGACAAVVVGIRRGLLDTPVTVHTHGGALLIDWPAPSGSVRMAGPAVTVFSGEIELD
jgi:diaminopimelate epimerase